MRAQQPVLPNHGSTGADRLTKVSHPGFGEAFTLDGAGRRVATKTSTGVGVSDTETVFDGLDPVAQTGGASADRTMLGGVEMGSDGSVSWKLTDRAGDVVAVTGADGGVVAMAGYSDFGVTKTTGDWDVLTAHSGELSDPTVGMDLYYRRAYDPLTANWGQADPYRGLLSAPQSLNRYAFVNNNPVTSRDVLGYSADSASHYGSGAQSFFSSQHNAPKAKKKKKKTPPPVRLNTADATSRWNDDRNGAASGPGPAPAPAPGEGSSSGGGASDVARNRVQRISETIERAEAQRWEDAANYARFVNSNEGRQRTAELRNTLGFLRLAAGPNAPLNTNHLLAMQRWFGGDQGTTVWDDLPEGLQSILVRPANVIVGVPSAPKSSCATPLQPQYCNTTSSPDIAGVPRAPGEPGAGSIGGAPPPMQQGSGAGIAVPKGPGLAWEAVLLVLEGAAGCAALVGNAAPYGVLAGPHGEAVVSVLACAAGAFIAVKTQIDDSNPNWAGPK